MEENFQDDFSLKKQTKSNVTDQELLLMTRNTNLR